MRRAILNGCKRQEAQRSILYGGEGGIRTPVTLLG